MTGAALWMLLLAAVALLAVTALLAQPWWIEQRRSRLRARPFP
jgi:hypothetical protein